MFITIYQLARLFFFSALAWLVYAVGAATIVATVGRPFLWSLPAFERYPLGFFVGSGLWHIVLFVLGLAGLYKWPIMAGMTTIVAVLSIGHLARCLAAARPGHANIRWPANLEGAATIALGIGLIGAGTAFVLVRGLYPLGGHDYYMHYFSYLAEVVRSGSVQLNAAWYHFYDSKGLSLTFLAMVLTDPLAPGSVSTVFAAFGTCVVYAILRHTTGDRLLPLCGALLYVVFFAVGNDELEKQHVTTAVLSLTMLWASIRLLDKDANRCPWIIMLSASVMTMVLITVELGLLILIYLAPFIAWFSWRREWRRAIELLGVASLAAFGVVAMLALNYACTGLPLEHLLLESWPFANLNRLRDLGILFEVIALHYSFTGLATSTGTANIFAPAQPWSLSLARLLAEDVRLSLWWPLFAPVVLFIPWRLWNPTVRRSISRRYLSAFLPLCWISVCIVALFVASGRTEVDLFKRVMSLAYPVPLCLGLLMWHLALRPLGPTPSRWLQLIPIATACAALAFLWPQASYWTGRPELSWSTSYRGAHGVGLSTILANGWSFLSGRFSLRDAYQHQLGWEAKHPTGGIGPASRNLGE